MTARQKIYSEYQLGRLSENTGEMNGSGQNSDSSKCEKNTYGGDLICGVQEEYISFKNYQRNSF